MSSESVPERDPDFWNRRATIAALLFKVMPVDGEIHELERLRLNRILSDEFSLEQEEVDALVREAKDDARHSADLSELSDRINLSLDHDGKMNLISHMWEMVFADGKLHEFELLLVERVAKLLGLQPEEVSKMMKNQRLNQNYKIDDKQ